MPVPILEKELSSALMQVVKKAGKNNYGKLLSAFKTFQKEVLDNKSDKLTDMISELVFLYWTIHVRYQNFNAGFLYYF